MSRADNWAGNIKPMENWDYESRSMDTARLIAEKPITITLIRNGIALSPQTVRVEPYRHPHEQNAQNSWRVSLGAVVIVGYREHPTIPNTDIQRDDNFLYQDQLYTVVNFLSAVRDRLIVIADVGESNGG